jgi:hypothetical protein
VVIPPLFFDDATTPNVLPENKYDMAMQSDKMYFAAWQQS